MAATVLLGSVVASLLLCVGWGWLLLGSVLLKSWLPLNSDTPVPVSLVLFSVKVSLLTMPSTSEESTVLFCRVMGLKLSSLGRCSVVAVYVISVRIMTKCSVETKCKILFYLAGKTVR